jgi:hypothetical protein
MSHDQSSLVQGLAVFSIAEDVSSVSTNVFFNAYRVEYFPSSANVTYFIDPHENLIPTDFKSQ